jgi:hypothetical protein
MPLAGVNHVQFGLERADPVPEGLFFVFGQRLFSRNGSTLLP